MTGSVATPPAVRAVLFDLDGTLVDTATEICDAVNETLAALDLPRVSLAKVKSWIGHGTGWPCAFPHPRGSEA